MEAARRKAIHEAIVRLADGDRAAFDQVADELWPVILAFVRRGVGSSPDAGDVAQEGFVRLCARIADFDRRRDALSWAFGIASYELLTHRRRIQRRSETGDEALARRADPVPSQEETAIRRELEGALTRALGELSEGGRAALSPVGAAPGPTLRKRRQRAVDRLRAIWRRAHGEP